MKTPIFIDCHTHTQFSIFDSDRDAVIHRALDAGVAMVNIGTKKETSQSAIGLAHSYENVYATIGLHPIHTHKSFHDQEELGGGKGFTSSDEVFDYEFYKKLAGDDKVVAIGECGLDYYRFKNDDLEFKNKQREVFIKQIELAQEIQKPLMIHCREAMNDLIEILKSYIVNPKSSPGIIHFFSGTAEEAKKLLDMEFYFTFGGVITFPPKAGKHSDYDEVVRLIPIDRIFSETDAPYVAPVPYRGKRNEPAYVVEVVKKLAELKKVSIETMANQILKNARGVFRIKF